jgi:hypothetical protein
MFPKPRALTPTRSTVAWSAAEVQAWIADKLTTPTGQHAANDGTFDGTCSEHTLQAA